MKMQRSLGLALVAAFTVWSAAVAADQTPAAKESTPATGTSSTTTSTHHAKKSSHMHLTKDEIMSVQNALARSGEFKGTPNGMMNKETEQALRAYQKANGLKVTGYANSATLKKLGVEHHAHTTASHKTTQSSMQSGTPAPEKK